MFCAFYGLSHSSLVKGSWDRFVALVSLRVIPRVIRGRIVKISDGPIDRLTNQIALRPWQLPPAIRFDKLFAATYLHPTSNNVLEHERLRRIRIAPVVGSVTVNHSQQ